MTDSLDMRTRGTCLQVRVMKGYSFHTSTEVPCMWLCVKVNSFTHFCCFRMAIAELGVLFLFKFQAKVPIKDHISRLLVDSFIWPFKKIPWCFLCLGLGYLPSQYLRLPSLGLCSSPCSDLQWMYMLWVFCFDYLDSWELTHTASGQQHIPRQLSDWQSWPRLWPQSFCP